MTKIEILAFIMMTGSYLCLLGIGYFTPYPMNILVFILSSILFAIAVAMELHHNV